MSWPPRDALTQMVTAVTQVSKGMAGHGSRSGSDKVCCSNTPLYNTINCLHQALPCFCHVTLLTFHVIVFAKCSQFSISQPCLPLSLICAIPDESSGLPRSSVSQTQALKACVSKTLVAVLHFYYFLFKAGH